ncbi:MAG: LemA family protein [Candidatus Shapirobacteria bacterium]|nr:LemA family protein [Candidatus Shapirobacteria bacterium]
MIYAIIILIVLAIYLVSFFNGLKTSEVQITASIQEIGNQLKRQAQLIPSLVDSVKGYLTHEKGIFDELTAARKSIDTAVASQNPKEIDQAQNLINKALGSLKVVVESNPEIKAAGLVSDLMNELRDTADKVMYARRTLIDLSADFNIKISTIPGIWLAPMFGFTKKVGLDTPVSGEFLSVSSAETATPKVNL